MMYIIFIIDHIHYLISDSKMLIFTYNSDPDVYYIWLLRNKIMLDNRVADGICRNFLL